MLLTYDCLLEQLIELNKEYRKEHDADKAYYDCLQFVLKFGTIRLDIGRCVGKSKFIGTHATESDLIIVPNIIHKRNYIGREIPTKAKIFSVNDIYEFTDDEFDTIYIDEPEMVFENNDMYNILKPYVNNYDQTIIMLGK